MDHHRSSYSPFHHRQSLRPAVGGTMASRYGLGSGSSSPSRRTSSAIGSSAGSSASAAASSAAAAAMNTGADITSGVVSFMKKFVSKASNSNSIDSSFQKYQQQMQKEQKQRQTYGSGGSATRTLFASVRDSSMTPTAAASAASTSSSSYQPTASVPYGLASTSGPMVVTTTAPSSACSSALHYSDTGYSSNANSPATTPTISSHSTSPVPPVCSPTFSLSSCGGSNLASSDSRPMSATGSAGGGGSPNRGPFFSKIRAKVASTFQGSSSGGGTPTGVSTPTQPVAQPVPPQPPPPAPVPSTSVTFSTVNIAGGSGTTTANNYKTTTSSTTFVTSTISSALLDAQQNQQNRRASMAADSAAAAGAANPANAANAPYFYTSQSRPPMLSMIGSQSSSLTNEQLTAHLTEEERQILQKVFQKEEEFREIALKNMSSSASGFDSGGSAPGSSGGGSGSPSGQSNVASGGGSMLLPNQPVAGVSHLSANMLDPVAAAVHRRRSSAAMSADATGLCRICRKVIMKNESAHRCSNCHELVCDDCSSYSSREESKYWMCSFCRRRGSTLVLTTTITEPTTSTLTTSASFRNSISPTPSSSGGGSLQVAPTKRKSSFSEFTRVAVAEKVEQPRQNSLDLQRSLVLARKLSMCAQAPAVQNMPQPIILIKDMTTGGDEVDISNDSVLNSSRRASTNEANVLSPASTRPRIYSLSDDEELLTDEEDDDDDDDEELGDEDEEEDEDEDDEEDEEMLQLYNLEKAKDASLGEQQRLTRSGSFRIASAATAKKRAAGKRKKAKGKGRRKKSTAGTPNEPLDDEYIVGGQSHGTLASMSAETLKRRRSSKRKKKKKSSSFNSDDELFTSKSNDEGGSSNCAPEIVFEMIPPQSRLIAQVQQHQQQQQGQPFIQQGTSGATVGRSYTASGAFSKVTASGHSAAGNDPSSITSSFYSAAGKFTGNKQISSKWWLLSKKVGMLNRYPMAQQASSAPGGGGDASGGSPTPQIVTSGGMARYFSARPRKSSTSSDVSDQFRYSPPQESLTPSSEYSRSPRESADSDMLGLTYSSLAMQQRRSIPSVMIDGSSILGPGGGHFLTLKDCYMRRGSAGRALPTLPTVEPSRSMLDLPHSRKSSAHSLDIPMEQPRRASAPEGEGIRIVIDEVGGDGGTSCLDQTASSDSLPTTVYGVSSATPGGRSGSMSMASGKSSAGPGPQMVVVAPSHQTSYQTRMRYQLTRANSIVTHYERVVLTRDESDTSNRTHGFSLVVLGGKLNELDGMLYAYVGSVRPGGQAEAAGLKAGDKLLEWCGRQLVNCSYEQVAHIIDTSGSSAELLIETTVKCETSKRRQSLQSQQSTTVAPSEGQQPKQQVESKKSIPVVQPLTSVHYRPSSAAAGSLSGTAPEALSAPTQGGSSSVSPRRRLPQIPGSLAPAQPVSVATYLSNTQILLQVTLDPSIRQLSVMIVSATGLEPHPAFQVSANMEAYAQLRLLPEMGFKICKTELSKVFEWNETLIYHSFPLERVDEITLDLSVWTTDPTQVNPFPMLSSRSPRHSMGNFFQQQQQQEVNYQLASTRIPLRSALLYLSEWWPLIPADSYPPPTPPSGGTNLLDPTMFGGLGQSKQGQFFNNKTSSMEYLNTGPLGGNTLQIMNDGLMMSRSTPGSRRGSDRSDIVVMDMIAEQQVLTQDQMSQSRRQSNGDINVMPSTSARTSSFRHTPSPTRGSSDMSTSTGGRHSLDDSSYSNTSAAISNGRSSASSFNFGRSSLRLVTNRHSVANLYQVDPGGGQMFVRGSHLAPVPVGPVGRHPSADQMMRRKSSSALNGHNQISRPAVASNLNFNRPTTAAGHHPSDGYQQLMDDDGIGEASYQSYLTYDQHQPEVRNVSKAAQGSGRMRSSSMQPERSTGDCGDESDSSHVSTDDDNDVERFLGHSSYEQAPKQSESLFMTQPNSAQRVPPPALSPSNQLSVIDMTKLTVRSSPEGGGDVSRYSGTTSPLTPMHDDFDEDNPESSSSASNLLAPNWASGGRRSSFLRRLIPMGTGNGSTIAGSDAIAATCPGGTVSFGTGGDFRSGLSKSTKIVGEIKIGFIMTKGFLEIEVIGARNLPESSTANGGAPDTYVKTYLRAGDRQREKRKTRTILEDRNPQYRQTLKYDASIIYGRSLLVSVWEKPRRTFESNIPIGAVDINVNQLELNKLTIRWYRLRAFLSPDEAADKSAASHLVPAPAPPLGETSRSAQRTGSLFP